MSNAGFQAGIHGKWHTERKHESRGRHKPIRDKLTSDVQVKLELVKGVLRSKKWISQNYTRRVVYLYTSYFG